MLSGDASCSDCRLELVQRLWTELLLNWINTCITPQAPVSQLHSSTLVNIIDRYKLDICSNDLDRAMLCTDDLEPFLRYSYPILRLRYLSEPKDISKKLYIMTSVLLFHCCVRSRTGAVTGDICRKIDKLKQEMIVKFCELLGGMEVTIHNVESAIREACQGTSIRSNESVSQKKTNHERTAKHLNIGSYGTQAEPAVGIPSDVADGVQMKSYPTLKFKSSVTVLSSCVDTSSYSKMSLQPVSSTSDCTFEDMADRLASDSNEVAIYNVLENVAKGVDRKVMTEEEIDNLIANLCDPNPPSCKPDCACTRCSASGPCCGVPGSSVDCDNGNISPEDENGTDFDKRTNFSFNWLAYSMLVGVVLITVAIVLSFSYLYFISKGGKKEPITEDIGNLGGIARSSFERTWEIWECTDGVCKKTFQPDANTSTLYNSRSRCTLLCMGPQVIWPQPIGYTYFSNSFVALSTNKLQYKFRTVPSEKVHQHLAEAFKLFIGDLARLERTVKRKYQDLTVNTINIQIDIQSDTDPKLKLHTDESYTITIDSYPNQVKVVINSVSFCGVRHGLETLGQLILLDESTGHLITLSEVIVKDAPIYKYRGLMIDTGRNYIPIPSIMRTVDAMATCKLNTFHWRISDVASLSLLLPELSNLFEYGAFDSNMVYSKEDVKSVVKRAEIRGIRVLIEVAIPGPVGKPWSWFKDVTCPRNVENGTCDNILCSRLNMKESIFDILRYIYSKILEIAGVDDVFHVSDGVFSMANCYYLNKDRDRFLEKALDRLRLTKKGPMLPIIWYSKDLNRNFENKAWERMGVQLLDWLPGDWDQNFNRYKVIQSTKWDLSCEMTRQRCVKYRNWQEMYSWKTWRTIDAFSIEGGESVLFTDLVDSGNLDYHLWPRAAAVAEQLWSDLVSNNTASGHVYVRLDNHRRRMLLRGIKVQPIWPLWCSSNPWSCLTKVPH